MLYGYGATVSGNTRIRMESLISHVDELIDEYCFWCWISNGYTILVFNSSLIIDKIISTSGTPATVVISSLAIALPEINSKA